MSSSDESFNKLQNMTVEKSLDTQTPAVPTRSTVAEAVDIYARQSADPLFMATDVPSVVADTHVPHSYLPTRRGSEDAFQRWGPL